VVRQSGQRTLSNTSGRWAGPIEGRGEQVTGGQAAGWPPFFGDGDDLLLARQVVELLGALHGLAQRQVARQHRSARSRSVPIFRHESPACRAARVDGEQLGWRGKMTRKSLD